jgi:TetR/AcrR family transcriptional repressor of uid operon
MAYPCPLGDGDTAITWTARDDSTAGAHRAPGSRARQRLDTRERIFEVALGEFRSVGVAAAQVDRIARAAGVARGTFYFHFPTKDDVLLELAARVSARIAQRIHQTLDASRPSLRELLTRVNDAITEEHGRVGETGLLAEMLSLHVRRPHDLADPTGNVPNLIDELARQLAAAEARGELVSRLPVEQLAFVFATSLFGIFARTPGGEVLRSTCEAWVDLVVRGLESESPAGRSSGPSATVAADVGGRSGSA